MPEEQSPVDRLAFSGELSAITDRLCVAYGIGRPVKYDVLGTGYEDCNVVMETEQGKFLAKMFAKNRSPEEIDRYSTIMQKVVDEGVNHPALLTLKSGEATYADSGITLVCMQFIEGKTFFELGRAPNSEERKLVVEQMAKINKINYKPTYFFNSWATPHIQDMYDGVRQFMAPDDLELVERTLAGYTAIPVEDLPHCFAHGDLAKTNVIKSNDGKIYILDFSVANWYPRILDLSVVAGNLMHTDDSSLADRCDQLAGEYGLLNPLTSEERQHLPAYALAGLAMEFMGALQEKHLHGIDTEENNYWLNLGRNGLKKALK